MRRVNWEMIVIIGMNLPEAVCHAVRALALDAVDLLDVPDLHRRGTQGCAHHAAAQHRVGPEGARAALRRVALVSRRSAVEHPIRTEGEGADHCGVHGWHDGHQCTWESSGGDKYRYEWAE